MLESNAEQAFENLEQFLIKLKPDDTFMGEIAITTLGNNKRRVHNEGLNVAGGKIGDYKGGELYVNPKNSPKSFGANIGKTGESKFKDGRTHKTKYFKDYKGFRAKIGRDTSKVNLELFGDLRRGYVVEKRSNSYLLGIVSKEVDKYKGLLSKYGRFYGLSKEDRQLIRNGLLKRIKLSSR